MWNNWAGYVLYFKDFIVVTALVGAAFTIWFAVLTRRFSWKKRNRAIYGALLNRSDRELVCVSAILMQWLFVFSAAICGTEVELPHLMFLLIVPLVKLGAGMGMGTWLRDFLNGGLLFGTLMVANILTGYLKETRFNIFVVVILILLKLFAVFYETYFGMRDTYTCFIRRSSEEKREEVQEDGPEYQEESTGIRAEEVEPEETGAEPDGTGNKAIQEEIQEETGERESFE